MSCEDKIIYVECLGQWLTCCAVCLLLLSRIGNIVKFILQSVTEVIFGKSDCLGGRGVQGQAETSVSYIVCFHVIVYDK